MENFHLDKKSKILLIIFILLTILSVAATHYNTIVSQNFVIIDDLDEMEMEE